MASTRLVCLALLLALVAAGCSHDAGQSGRQASSPSSQVAPRLGGPAFEPVPVPTQPMGRLERPIAASLAAKARAEGLTLDYLACPTWDRAMPHRLRCTGYFDGVKAPVLVRIATVAGGSVAFDAEIGNGVVSTRNLVRHLHRHGFTDVDCGDRAAYPSRTGLRVVCAVSRNGSRKYVVATVTNGSGAVAISDY